MKKIFIDGREGTTGLQIYERLTGRTDIELMLLPEEKRKDADSRCAALNGCDIAILCLPDEAARQAISMIHNDDVIVLDASTAHRTHPDWVYGLPELSREQYQAVKHARRVAVPGCHASGFVALVAPLVKAGILPDSAKLSCHSITGYSGGGKKMIAQYEAMDRDALLDAPRQYGIAQNHKHLPEMQYMTGLQSTPAFCPIVADFYSGMLLTIPLFAADLAPNYTAEDIRALYAKQYCSGTIAYKEALDESGFISAAGMSKTDAMQVTVSGNDEHMLLIARYDNLGKGASGAAVQCLDIILGLQ